MSIFSYVYTTICIYFSVNCLFISLTLLSFGLKEQLMLIRRLVLFLTYTLQIFPPVFLLTLWVVIFLLLPYRSLNVLIFSFVRLSLVTNRVCV